MLVFPRLYEALLHNDGSKEVSRMGFSQGDNTPVSFLEV
jgi:hypothetical protein